MERWTWRWCYCRFDEGVETSVDDGGEIRHNVSRHHPVLFEILECVLLFGDKTR